MPLITWRLPDVIPEQMGGTGHSGGGCTALWLSLLDERITAVVVSGYFNAFKDSIVAMPHCECNYVPGLLSLGEMGDWAALMAPRPFCIVHGQQDAIFPIEAAQTPIFQRLAVAHMGNNCPGGTFTVTNTWDSCDTNTFGLPQPPPNLCHTSKPVARDFTHRYVFWSSKRDSIEV